MTYDLEDGMKIANNNPNIDNGQQCEFYTGRDFSKLRGSLLKVTHGTLR